tara:strand:+ start:418 stop:531 length:114 start_codon:yes stop_codon:yes gene_type:complete
MNIAYKAWAIKKIVSTEAIIQTPNLCVQPSGLTSAEA